MKNIYLMAKKVLFIFEFWNLFILVHLSTLLRKHKRIQKTPNSILFLENFPIENSGYQYRAKKWANLLNNKGINCEVLTILESKTEFDNALKNEPFSKFMLQAIKIRYQQCLYAKKFETVIVRRELLFQNDYGNLFMEKFLLKIHPNVILDFDNDISAAKQLALKQIKYTPKRGFNLKILIGAIASLIIPKYMAKRINTNKAKFS